MKKIDDRFIDTTYANPNSLTTDDIQYDASTSAKDAIDSAASAGVSENTVKKWAIVFG